MFAARMRQLTAAAASSACSTSASRAAFGSAAKLPARRDKHRHSRSACALGA